MTNTKNIKKVQAPAVVKMPTNVTTLIKALDGKRNNYTSIRNAVIAHVVGTGVTQSVVVAETGLTKSAVSEVVGNVAKLSKANKLALARLDVTAIDVDDTATHDEALRLGKLLVVKRDGTQGKGKGRAPKADKSESTDALADLAIWLGEAKNLNQLGARIKLVNEAIAAATAALKGAKKVA